MSWHVKLRLSRWGKWAKWGPMGYPSHSAQESVRGAVTAESEPPQEIQEINAIVNRAEPDDKQILIAYYAQGGSKRAVAQRLGINRETFRRRLDSAVCYVGNELDNCVTPELHSGTI